MVYDQSKTLVYALHEEGTVQGTGAYQYHLKDHLGNTRAVFSKAAGSGQAAALVQATDYYPFGKSFENVDVGSKNRYLYNGKELQDQSIGGTTFGWYDYGKRFYDPDGARFMSVDPLAEKYYFQSVYAYAANNPIRFIDWMGMGPGDLFTSTKDAAKDWAKTYNGPSIILKSEYGSTIYETKKDGKTYYAYNVPLTYGKDGQFSTPINRETPKDTKSVADIHSHSNYVKESDNNFSGTKDENGNRLGDLRQSKTDDIGSNNEDGTKGYVSTPNGSLLEYNPETGKITTIVSKDIPSDPKDPKRVTNKDPEPTRPVYNISNNKPN